MKSMLICLLFCLPFAAAAQETTGRYDVRALGVKVGEFAVTGTVRNGRYTVASQFTTTGLAGAVAGVKFILQANGRVRGSRFQPLRYSEDMDTGKRSSRARLRYSGGVARASGSEIGDRGAYAVTDAQQKGAVDPLTAMFMILRDQPASDLCKLRQRIFDGERLTEVALTNRADNGDTTTCRGSFRRVAGYSPDDLKRKKTFAITATYARAGDLMRLEKVRADTTYGPATLTRR